MAKNSKPEKVSESVPSPENQRSEAWKRHVENYAEKNPVKYAAKKARGEFDKIPDTFTVTNQLHLTK